VGEGFEHVPVMGRTVVELFAPIPAGLVVDATVGGAGHARLLLEARADLELLGIDRDPDAVAAAREALAPYGSRAEVVHAGFERIGELIARRGEGEVTGVLMDLGVSSPQLDRPERGFSYRHDAPLDMRMDSSQSLTAADVVNGYPEDELALLIARYGEERFARRIAAAVVRARPLTSTRELAELVRDAIPAATRRRGGHPARRTFQAIRMEVNRELPNLAEGLDDVVRVVAPGGRIVVLAYHSLEDRVVKERFTDWSATEEPGTARLPVPTPRAALTRLLTRRPRRPTAEEIALNPRAESARLRAVERLGWDAR
jgi:16S rRNA (cytosine1402-N4)-methyltransferase